MRDKIFLKNLGLKDYQVIWHLMRDFTLSRDKNTIDEIWFLEHFPVFTSGLLGKKEDILNAYQIPVVQTDRGGRVTYHGPGQLICYLLIDLHRRRIGVRNLVRRLEDAIVMTLDCFGIKARANINCPGVYVNDAKICSVGLRISRGCSYHGIALNVDMNVKPFSYINPCGVSGLKITQIKDFVTVTLSEVQKKLSEQLLKMLSFKNFLN